MGLRRALWERLPVRGGPCIPAPAREADTPGHCTGARQRWRGCGGHPPIPCPHGPPTDTPFHVSHSWTWHWPALQPGSGLVLFWKWLPQPPGAQGASPTSGGSNDDVPPSRKDTPLCGTWSSMIPQRPEEGPGPSPHPPGLSGWWGLGWGCHAEASTALLGIRGSGLLSGRPLCWCGHTSYVATVGRQWSRAQSQFTKLCL